MRRRISGIIILTITIFLLTQSSSAPLWACAAVMHPNKERSVEIASESALIVWDAKAKKQHFIRRASFKAAVPYFGFLVPTPNQPQLAEAPDELFSHLEEWTRPEIRTETKYKYRSYGGCGADSMIDKRSAPGNVQILDQVSVGGYDASVLKATDTKALQDWLAKHGYNARQSLMQWLDPYVKAGWIITAFQISKEKKDTDQLTPQAVRMSFTTERPFFPYSEPTDQRDEKVSPPRRLLRVYFLADQRMEGALGGKEVTWPGETAWAGPLQESQVETLNKNLSDLSPVANNRWLTVFDDHASPRPGKSDVFFSPSSDQSEVRRPAIIRYRYEVKTSPEEIVGGLIFVGMFLSLFVLLWLLSRPEKTSGVRITIRILLVPHAILFGLLWLVLSFGIGSVTVNLVQSLVPNPLRGWIGISMGAILFLSPLVFVWQFARQRRSAAGEYPPGTGDGN